MCKVDRWMVVLPDGRRRPQHQVHPCDRALRGVQCVQTEEILPDTYADEDIVPPAPMAPNVQVREPSSPVPKKKDRKNNLRLDFSIHLPSFLSRKKTQDGGEDDSKKQPKLRLVRTRTNPSQRRPAESHRRQSTIITGSHQEPVYVERSPRAATFDHADHPSGSNARIVPIAPRHTPPATPTSPVRRQHRSRPYSYTASFETGEDGSPPNYEIREPTREHDRRQAASAGGSSRSTLPSGAGNSRTSSGYREHDRRRMSTSSPAAEATAAAQLQRPQRRVTSVERRRHAVNEQDRARREAAIEAEIAALNKELVTAERAHVAAIRPSEIADLDRRLGILHARLEALFRERRSVKTVVYNDGYHFSGDGEEEDDYRERKIEVEVEHPENNNDDDDDDDDEHYVTYSEGPNFQRRRIFEPESTARPGSSNSRTHGLRSTASRSRSGSGTRGAAAGATTGILRRRNNTGSSTNTQPQQNTTSNTTSNAATTGTGTGARNSGSFFQEHAQRYKQRARDEAGGASSSSALPQRNTGGSSSSPRRRSTAAGNIPANSNNNAAGTSSTMRHRERRTERERVVYDDEPRDGGNRHR